VILDRRGGERRRTQRPPLTERRHWEWRRYDITRGTRVTGLGLGQASGLNNAIRSIAPSPHFDYNRWTRIDVRALDTLGRCTGYSSAASGSPECRVPKEAT
jgi:hypothetical protein